MSELPNVCEICLGIFMDQHRTERSSSPHLKNFTLLLLKKWWSLGMALKQFFFLWSWIFYLRNRTNQLVSHWYRKSQQGKKKRAGFQRISMGDPRRKELELFVVFLKLTSWFWDWGFCFALVVGFLDHRCPWPLLINKLLQSPCCTLPQCL